jgi:hypothetical protein
MGLGTTPNANGLRYHRLMFTLSPRPATAHSAARLLNNHAYAKTI